MKNSKMLKWLVMLMTLLAFACEKKKTLKEEQFPSSPDELIKRLFEQTSKLNSVEARFKAYSQGFLLRGFIYVELKDELKIKAEGFSDFGTVIFQLIAAGDDFQYIYFPAQAVYSNKKEILGENELQELTFDKSDELKMLFLARNLNLLIGRIPEGEYKIENKLQDEIILKSLQTQKLQRKDLYTISLQPLAIKKIEIYEWGEKKLELLIGSNPESECFPFPEKLKLKTSDYNLQLDFQNLDCTDLEPKEVKFIPTPSNFKSVWIKE